jgi:hypothetical protein
LLITKRIFRSIVGDGSMLLRRRQVKERSTGSHGIFNDARIDPMISDRKESDLPTGEGDLPHDVLRLVVLIVAVVVVVVVKKWLQVNQGDNDDSSPVTHL